MIPGVWNHALSDLPAGTHVFARLVKRSRSGQSVHIAIFRIRSDDEHADLEAISSQLAERIGAAVDPSGDLVLPIHNEPATDLAQALPPGVTVKLV